MGRLDPRACGSDHQTIRVLIASLAPGYHFASAGSLPGEPCVRESDRERWVNTCAAASR